MFSNFILLFIYDGKPTVLQNHLLTHSFFIFLYFKINKLLINQQLFDEFVDYNAG